jgi:hypothetical protein
MGSPRPSYSHFFRAPNGQKAETGKPPTGRQDQPSSGSQRAKPNTYFLTWRSAVTDSDSGFNTLSKSASPYQIRISVNP